GEGEDGASADLVGQQSAEARADRHPGEAGGGDEGAVGLREVPVDGQGGDDEGDQADVHRVQRPADAGGAQQPAVLAGEGEAVQALSGSADGGPARSPERGGRGSWSSPTVGTARGAPWAGWAHHGSPRRTRPATGITSRGAVVLHPAQDSWALSANEGGRVRAPPASAHSPAAQ